MLAARRKLESGKDPGSPSREGRDYGRESECLYGRLASAAKTQFERPLCTIARTIGSARSELRGRAEAEDLQLVVFRFQNGLGEVQAKRSEW